MLKEIAWNFFLQTGDIDTYLSYKKIEDKINCKEDQEYINMEKEVNHEVI